MTTTIEDVKGGMSSCCFAPIYLDQGICSDCKENCDDVEDDTLPSKKQQTALKRLKALLAEQGLTTEDEEEIKLDHLMGDVDDADRAEAKDYEQFTEDNDY